MQTIELILRIIIIKCNNNHKLQNFLKNLKKNFINLNINLNNKKKEKFLKKQENIKNIKVK